MKTILSAQFANASQTAVVLATQEAGAVLIEIGPGQDVSGGWRAVWEAWEGETAAYVEPTPEPLTVEEHFAASGFSLLALLNLLDLSTRLPELPEKAAAVRAWVTDQQTRFALGQSLTPAPHSYPDVLAELLAPLLAQP
jgi:hypothetical protein